MLEYEDPFRRKALKKYFQSENLELIEIKEGSKIIIQTKKHTYTFEVERPASGGEYARGKLKGGNFVDEDKGLEARIHGSIVPDSDALQLNKIKKGLSLEFSILKDEITGKHLNIEIDKTRSIWQTITTSKIENFKVIPPDEEITPEKIIGE